MVFKDLLGNYRLFIKINVCQEPIMKYFNKYNHIPKKYFEGIT